MVPNTWNRMVSRLIPLGLVHKTLESDFRKNDTISTRSPSSNAIDVRPLLTLLTKINIQIKGSAKPRFAFIFDVQFSKLYFFQNP